LLKQRERRKAPNAACELLRLRHSGSRCCRQAECGRRLIGASECCFLHGRECRNIWPGEGDKANPTNIFSSGNRPLRCILNKPRQLYASGLRASFAAPCHD
jgi:hypothetical protein